jgi:signal transduction histidine kinase
MRRRLALAIVAVTAGAIVLFAVPLGIALRKVYRDEDLLRLERDTVAATRAIDVGPGRGRDPVEIPRSTDRRVVYDRGGHVLAGTAAAGDAAIAREAVRTGRPAVHDGGGGVVAAVPILSSERVTGVLVAARSGAGSSHDTHQAWLLLAALAAAVMLAAIAAALFVARGLSRPLERLAASARRLGVGDFTARAPRSHVPEVDEVAEALDTTAARLGELVTRERAFSADASHQLRTPLTALRIELEGAELKGGGADPVTAMQQVDRLEQTIDTLLAAARRTGAGAAETELVALAEQLEAEWRPRLAADGRRLNLEVDRARLPVAADPAVVREILNVLLENACHHGRGAVTLRLASVDVWGRVEVSDEGPGFGDDPEQAFERGTSRDGHGIGLALARSLAHAEGGALSVLVPGSCPVIAVTLRRADAAT